MIRPIFASLAILACSGPVLAAPRPNVLFIAVDDLNDWCGVMGGHPQARTPNLDRLAARGTFFERAYCAAPSCQPSRVSVMTGLRPSTSGDYVNEQKLRKLLPDVVTMPQYFTAQGYRVVGGGKIFHHGDTDPRSWPEYFPQPKDPVPRPLAPSPISDHWSWQPLDEPDEAMGDCKVVSWATDWLAKNKQEPFFLAVGLYRPHMPLHVPRKYFDMFPLDKIVLPVVKENDLDDVPEMGRWLPLHRGYHEKIVAAGQCKHAVQGYLAAVAFFDAMLGRLIEAFDRSLHRDNTIIVLWSDHGWHHGQKQNWSKFALWEQATRAPFLIVAPGVTKPNQRCSAPVSLLDIYPTLMELCGLPRPKEIDGASLVPLLKNPAAPRADPAVMTWGPNSHAVRDARWRYIRYADGTEELYDHQNDSYEWTNLAGRPEHNETKQRLVQWLPKINKPLLTRTQWLPPSPRERESQPAAEIAPTLSGIIVDDEQAVFTGEWTLSAKQRALVGKGYRHDGNTGRGTKSAVFTPDIPQAGRYEVRVLYTSGANRSTLVPVTVRSADGEKTVLINQRKEPQPLGVFNFAAGKTGSVTVSNKDADSFVVVDAVEFVLQGAPPEGDAPSSPVSRKKSRGADRAAPSDGISKPPPHEPVQLAKDAKPSDVDGKTFDLVVIGATPGGIACAVRAARAGLSVLLVQHNRHIGGMLANGLMQWDALYGGPRAPIFNQYAKMIEDHYRKTYGEKSPQYQQARYTQEHYPMSRFEPSVAEREFNRLVAAEKNITLLLSHYPSVVERNGALLKRLTLKPYSSHLAPRDEPSITVHATVFADGTYEGDLAALAKVPYRVGREGRDEYGEPHAGKVFTNIKSGRGPRDAVEGRLNLRPYGHVQGSIDPTSPFTADGAIQAYNHRFCLSDEPGQIRLPKKPPGYNREEYVNFNRKGMSAGDLNGKSLWNAAILPGENHAYPDATWPEREKIIERHKNFALGLMWFLQNDESVKPASRARYRQIGLPLDEFPDNDNLPYEIYVREARRIVGRYVYREQDNSLAPGLGRAPVQSDSIAFTDWAMDSHDCTTDRRPGYDFDGKLILTEESRPGQIPYRTLLPQGVDNLLVPVCLSATHVAWGAVRLEPVWMQTGEAAGFAAALSKKHGVTPAALDFDLLVRTLCKAGCVVSFFNEKEALHPAAQYFGTKGFFHDYNARLSESLKPATAKVWAGTKLDAPARARAIAEAEKSAGIGTTTRGAVLQSMWESLK